MITQMKKVRNLGLMLLAIFAITFTSCDRGEDLVNIDNFTDSTIEDLQFRAIGKNHCLEFIFPINIQFIDESTAEIDSYENLHETVKSWFEENDVEKSKENKPQLLFPIQVMNSDGELIDVASQDELKELRSECPKRGKCKGHKGRGFKCFSLVFPVTVTIDGTDGVYNDKSELKDAIKAYKEEAGEDAERPTLVFPITIEYEDETQVEVSSQEELQELKDACKEG